MSKEYRVLHGDGLGTVHAYSLNEAYTIAYGLFNDIEDIYKA